MRYRLVPSRGAVTWHKEGLDAARASAQAAYEASGSKPADRIPVLVCEAPVGGIVRHLETIGGNRGRVRRG